MFFIYQLNEENDRDIELNDEEEYTKPIYETLRLPETWVHKYPAIRKNGRITISESLNEE